MKRLILFIWLVGCCAQFLYVPWVLAESQALGAYRATPVSYRWIFDPPTPDKDAYYKESPRIAWGPWAITLGAWTCACGAALCVVGIRPSPQPRRKDG